MTDNSQNPDGVSTNASWLRNLALSWRYLRLHQKLSALCVIVCLTISALLDLFVITAVLPIVSRLSGSESLTNSNAVTRFLESVWQRDASQSAMSMLVIFALILILKTLLQISIRYVVFKLRVLLTVEVTSDLLRRYLLRPYLLHRKQPTSRLVRDVNEAGILVFHQLGPFSSVVSELSLLLGTLTFFLLVAPLITLVLLVVGGGLVFVFDRMFSRLSVRQGNIRLFEDEVKHRKLTDAFMGFPLIKKYQLEPRVTSEISTNIQKSVAAHESIGLIGELMPLLMEASVIVAICIAVATSQYIGPAEIDLLPLLSFIAVGVLRLIPGVGRITSAVQYLKFWSARNASLLADLTTRNASTSHVAQYDKEPPTNQLDVEIVTLEVKEIEFRFDGESQEVLRDISFELKSGEIVGLVGPSGCGKSTLLEVIAGLLPESSGKVVVRSESGRSLALDSVALVAQRTFLFSASFRENLLLGVVNRVVSDDELWDVLRTVELDQFVEANPLRLNQLVGEGGRSVSGGQAQRIGLARALLSRPRFLLLDEATNALEEDLEMRIMQRIRRMNPLLAILVVSHRSATLELCDRIEHMISIRGAAKGSPAEVRKDKELT